jgi:hypothetical protein
MSLHFLKKPFEKLKALNSPCSSSRNSSVDRLNGANGEKAGPNGKLSSGNSTEDTDSRSQSKQRRSTVGGGAAPSKKIDQKFKEVHPRDEGAMLYRPLSMNMSKRRENKERFQFKNIDIESKSFSFIATFARKTRAYTHC